MSHSLGYIFFGFFACDLSALLALTLGLKLTITNFNLAKSGLFTLRNISLWGVQLADELSKRFYKVFDKLKLVVVHIRRQMEVRFSRTHSV